MGGNYAATGAFGSVSQGLDAADKDLLEQLLLEKM